jgi:hypothetical protein
VINLVNEILGMLQYFDRVMGIVQWIFYENRAKGLGKLMAAICYISTLEIIKRLSYKV